jgi:uncharacterized protein with GYD domain
MIRYFTLIRFTDQGAKNIAKSPARAEAFRESAAKEGVTVEAQLWTTGAYDGVMILSALDERTILRCLAELNAQGNVRTESTRALTGSELAQLTGS